VLSAFVRRFVFRFVDFNVSRSPAASTDSEPSGALFDYFFFPRLDPTATPPSYVTFFSPRTSSKSYIESAFWVARGKHRCTMPPHSGRALRLCTPGELVRFGEKLDASRSAVRVDVAAFLGFKYLWYLLFREQTQASENPREHTQRHSR
jgi:hypothetical protein